MRCSRGTCRDRWTYITELEKSVLMRNSLFNGILIFEMGNCETCTSVDRKASTNVALKNEEEY